MAATLTFNDNFDNLSIWNGATDTGTWSTNFWYNDQWGNYSTSKGSTLSGNSEQQWYINANYAPTDAVNPWTVSNGVLTIEAKPTDAATKAQIGDYKYTSGMINSWHSFSQQYGYFEMSAQLPEGQGLWPAFWLMSEDGTWPPELDIMEVLGNNVEKLYTTAHSNASGSHTMSTKGTDVADMSSGYHTFAVDWQADKITWYFDGKEVYQTATPADMHKPMYIIANLAVGGSWPGNADSTTEFPAQMNIDYIRAWDSNPYTDDDPTTGSSSGSASAISPSNGIEGTAANDVLVGQASDNRIRGYDGDDHITGGTGFNNINGNAGADTVIGKSTVGDWLLGGKGADLIDASASSGHNIVNGNMGSDNILGGSGGDTLRGGQGDDTIIGGSGADWISGDKGSDVVTGGGGADTFHSWGGAGTMVVTDFHQVEGDRLFITGGASHTESQQGADVYVDIAGGARVILQNTQLSALSDGWIV